MSHPDPYEVLGVARNATAADVRRAYRTAALQSHPDRNPDPAAAERFRAVSAAYAVLKDPERRRRHDSPRRPFFAYRVPASKQELEAFARRAGGPGSRTSWNGETLVVERGGVRMEFRLART